MASSPCSFKLSAHPRSSSKFEGSYNQCSLVERRRGWKSQVRKSPTWINRLEISRIAPLQATMNNPRGFGPPPPKKTKKAKKPRPGSQGDEEDDDKEEDDDYEDDRERGVIPEMGVDLESVSEATSGAVGSLLSTTILYPLDTCKSKFQAEIRARGQQKYRYLSDVLWEAISKRQILSLYQGLGTKNLQSFISQFIYFYSYSYLKRVHSERTGSKSIGTKANLLIAAAAGACTSVLTQPLDTASSRMQTSEFGESKGLWKTLTGGAWGDAFDGLGISLLLTSNPAIQYTVFDQLKQHLLKQQTAKAENGSSPAVLSAFMAFLLGAVSKSVATVITYPAIRCKVMIQAADDSKEKETKKPIRRTRKTIPGVVYSIWRKEGMLGFFKGLQAQILKTVLSSALLLMIKEKITATTWILILAIRRTLFLTKVKLKSP